MVASTWWPSAAQMSALKISTSTSPVYPASVTQRPMVVKSMQPVAHHAAGQQGVRRDRQVEVADLVGRQAGPPGRLGRSVLQRRVPPDMEGVHDDARRPAPDAVPPGRVPGRGWTARRGRRSTSGAAAPAPGERRAPARTAPGRRSGPPPGPGHRRCPGRRAGSPPTTMISSPVPRVAASSIAARLSATPSGLGRIAGGEKAAAAQARHP